VTDELVHLDVDRGVATITLDSPHNRNALSRQLVTELTGHLDTALGSDDVRAIVLTGTGPVFCAGADLKEQSDGDGIGSATRTLSGLLVRLMRSPKPVVLKLNGATRAGGTGIVGACDIVVCPASATFAFPEVHLGLVPAIIAVTSTRQMDPRAVSRYFLTGEVFDAHEAARIGLVTTAVDDAEVDTTVERILAGLRKASPNALARTKQLLAELEGRELEDAFAHAADTSAEVFASDEAREGMLSFITKQPPSWAV
jgi:enoyl-CoA hydratase/carnithine racemase